MQEKLKSYLANDQVFYGLLVILVAVASFTLGRYSVLTGQSEEAGKVEINRSSGIIVAPVVSKTVVEAVPSQTTDSTEAGTLVGSKSGTKYHLKTCPGAKQIKPANLITFNSKAEAEAAGYSPASNCPGL